MFRHNFKYSFRILFRNKILLFWTFIFPIILGTLFYMAFSNIENSEKLQVFNIGIVDNEQYSKDSVLKSTLEKLGTESENQLFEISYGTKDELGDKLNNNEIASYLIIEEDLKVVVKENGINQTIFKQVIDEIIQTKNLVNDIVTDKIKEENMEILYSRIINNINNYQSTIKDNSKTNISYVMIEFYSLIAMTCLYGATLGMYAINNNLANMGKKGKRVSISPTKKIVTILSSSLASYITQLIGLSLLFIYTIFVLKVDYGNSLPHIILLAMIGCLAGCTFGIMIASLFKTNENNKIGVIISFTMLGSFLAGMMGITMKYVIDTNIPLLNKLNPVNMITDGFYALYYSGIDRYWMNITSLLVFSFIMILVTCVVLRRQKYDSI